ncbi:MAG: thioredoxin fold domain-containing protein [Rhodocyclaceae bacterium]|nr:thioredoxin fold domain-containing protein [Rhodocyclaceae bacterium]
MSAPHRLARLLAAAALALAAGLAQAELFATTAVDLARESAQGGRDGKLLAVLFEQDDCAACRELRQKVLGDKATGQAIAARYRTVAVDLSAAGELVTPDGKTLPAKDWAARLRVPGTPALAFFDARGRLLYRHVGPLADGRELQLLGRYVASEEYERRPFSDYLRTQKIGDRVSALQRESVCHTKS